MFFVRMYLGPCQQVSVLQGLSCFTLNIIVFTTIPMNFIHIMILLVLYAYMLFHVIVFYHVYVFILFFFDDTGQ